MFFLMALLAEGLDKSSFQEGIVFWEMGKRSLVPWQHIGAFTLQTTVPYHFRHP